MTVEWGHVACLLVGDSLRIDTARGTPKHGSFRRATTASRLQRRARKIKIEGTSAARGLRGRSLVRGLSHRE